MIIILINRNYLEKKLYQSKTVENLLDIIEMRINHDPSLFNSEVQDKLLDIINDLNRRSLS